VVLRVTFVNAMLVLSRDLWKQTPIYLSLASGYSNRPPQVLSFTYVQHESDHGSFSNDARKRL